jgi:hypothetical protein
MIKKAHLAEQRTVHTYLGGSVMTPEKQRPAEYGSSISHGVRTWVHRFRSLHGEPYVVALEVDEACLAIRAVANTEAHYRRSTSDVDDPKERARQRWNIERWLKTDQGPDFELLSAVLRNSAWQPSFESFRAMVFESMLLGLKGAAARGVFGPTNKQSRICLFLSTTDPALTIDLQASSAQQLNRFSEAEELLEHLEVMKPH